MKYLIFALFLILSCNSNQKNELNNIEKYINIEQKYALINALNFFDEFLINKYPNEKDINERIMLYINDHESAFFTQDKGDKFSNEFSKELELFNPYLQELDSIGFYDLIKTNSRYASSNDKRVVKWIDSIDQDFLNTGKFDKNLSGINNDTIDQNIGIEAGMSNETISDQPFVGYRNVFIYGLYNISEANSIEKDVLFWSVHPAGSNFLDGLKDSILRKKLSNPILKTYVFYTIVIKKYDLTKHCICLNP